MKISMSKKDDIFYDGNRFITDRLSLYDLSAIYRPEFNIPILDVLIQNGKPFKLDPKGKVDYDVIPPSLEHIFGDAVEYYQLHPENAFVLQSTSITTVHRHNTSKIKREYRLFRHPVDNSGIWVLDDVTQISQHADVCFISMERPLLLKDTQGIPFCMTMPHSLGYEIYVKEVEV